MYDCMYMMIDKSTVYSTVRLGGNAFGGEMGKLINFQKINCHFSRI